MGNPFKQPKVPSMPTMAITVPDAADTAIRNAKLMERRRQLGLEGRRSTWLTGARGDSTSDLVTATKTILGA